MIRPDTLLAIKAGRVDLAFRRWARPRVKPGTRLRTRIGLVEVLAVDPVDASAITSAEADRAGSTPEELARLLTVRSELPLWRVELRYAGPDPRTALRAQLPDAEEIETIRARLDRLDAASAIGPWTQATLAIIDELPTVRAPELADRLGRDTPSFKRDVRKLKELGLTESLDIGYRISPRGAAVLGSVTAAPPGLPLPRIGAPAARALRAEGIWTLDQVRTWTESDLAALHGLGPVALRLLRDALADQGWSFSG